MNAIDQRAARFQEVLQALKAQLTDITQSDYYRQLVNSGYYSVDVTLVDALQATQEAMQINEQIIAIVKLYPDDGLKMAIAKSLQSQADDDAFTEIEPYL